MSGGGFLFSFINIVLFLSPLTPFSQVKKTEYIRLIGKERKKEEKRKKKRKENKTKQNMVIHTVSVCT